MSEEEVKLLTNLKEWHERYLKLPFADVEPSLLKALRSHVETDIKRIEYRLTRFRQQ